MPTYVFRCEPCQHEFSVETSYSRKHETRCPECGGDQLKELFGRYTLNVAGSNGSSDAGPACSPMGGG